MGLRAYVDRLNRPVDALRPPLPNNNHDLSDADGIGEGAAYRDGGLG